MKGTVKKLLAEGEGPPHQTCWPHWVTQKSPWCCSSGTCCKCAIWGAGESWARRCQPIGMGLLMVLSAVGCHAPLACSGCAARTVEGEAGPSEAAEVGCRSLCLGTPEPDPFLLSVSPVPSPHRALVPAASIGGKIYRALI